MLSSLAGISAGHREGAMPHVQITMLQGRSTEQKRRAAKRITEVLQEELSVTPDKLTIIFVEVPRDSYARSGILVSDRHPAT
jgi:4-oxalocrotonate tautomerase